MKRSILLSVAILLITSPLVSQTVSIPDTAFLYALIDVGVDTNGDGLISYAEAEAVTSIEIEGSSNCDMGVCDPGNITSLVGIEAFLNLRTLSCRNNQIDSLDLSQNVALDTLICEFNQLTSLDVSGCTTLHYLNCLVNRLTNLDVSNNIALQTLDCRFNQLTSLDVSLCTSLTYLDLSGNLLASVDVSCCPALYDLNCSWNQLTSLDVSGRTTLHKLNCGRNRLTNLDVSYNTALISLDCSGNQLTSLDVSNNIALQTLDCGYNQLTSLDVSLCTSLTYLDLSGNLLASVDVSNNTALPYLRCHNMYTLFQICVSESYPQNYYDLEGSPNAYFTTECDTARVYINRIKRNIRLGSTGDPLNGLTVTWNSNGTSDSIAWGYTRNLEEGVYHGLKRDGVVSRMFDYTFPSLTAASTIHYTIFDSNESIWTEEKTFNTATDALNNKFSFTVFGDSRTYPDQWGIISKAALDTDFTLFLGDIVAHGRNLAEWDDWFEAGAGFIAREPIYHSIGGHDMDASPSRFENYLGLFTLPGIELYYSFTYGNAIFICLNSEDSGNTDQFNWLRSTLETNKDQTWKFVFFHVPFYSAPPNTGQMDDHLNTWWKAFDDYGVDMILNGHDHNYQRTKPINRNISTTSPVATYGSGAGMGRCQIVSGGAGAPLDDASNPVWWLDNSESKHHFCHIDIDGDILTFKAMDANQVVFDELVLDKSITGASDYRAYDCIVYPNPTNDLLTIETAHTGYHSITITSIKGQLMYSTKIEGTTHQLDLSSFQKRVYLITIRSKDFVTTRKIIKL